MNNGYDPHDDPRDRLAPARGIIAGLLVSAIIWIVLYLIYRAVT